MKKIKSKYDHNIVEQFLKKRYSKKEIGDFVDNLKKKGRYNNLLMSLEKLRQYDKNVDYLLFGSQWPKNNVELGKCIELLFYPHSVENEIEWLIIQISLNKSKLKKFIQYRNLIERLILLGNYSKAISLLEEEKEKLGLSIWYYEMKILLLMYQEKQNEVLELISKINSDKQNAKSGFVPYLMHFIYRRSIIGLSAYDYDMDLERRFKRDVTTFQKDRLEYFLIRLNYFRSLKYSSNPSVLLMEGTNSLIDRYITLQNVIKARFVTEPNVRKSISSYAYTIYLLTKDTAWYSYLVFLDIELPLDYYDEDFINIIDSYYIGDYQKTCTLCKSYIINKPENFDVIKFYCRSLIFIQNGFSPISSVHNSILNQISELVFHIMIGDKRNDYLYKLYQLNKNLYGLSIASSIDSYIQDESSTDSDMIISIMSSRVFDPYVCKILPNNDSKLSYLKKGIQLHRHSIVLPYQIHRIENQITTDKQVVGYIRDVDNARILFEQCNYDDCIRLMTSVLEQNSNCIPIIQTAVKYIFESYYGQKKLEKAINFYSTWFIQNEAAIIKIQTETFLKELKKNRYRGIKYSINLLIFVLKNALRETDKSFVVETYMQYKELKSIKDLVMSVKEENIKKQECFLILLNSEEFFQHTIMVSSSKEILENRQFIIQRLIALNTPNIKEYENMSQVIMQQMIVYEGTEKMDESKIYANIPAIIKYELDGAKRLYEQFKVQMELTRNNVVYMFYDAINDKESKNEKEGLYKHIKFTDYALKEISHQLFLSICIPFLKSKFGLGSYLSARIRHGVIDGQLQAGFIGKGILLQTENNEYLKNLYWQQTYGLSDTENIVLQNVLAKFSRGVNNTIMNFKENVLQIRMNDDDKGLFDYRLSEDQICVYVLQAYTKSNDFVSFCSMLMLILQGVTEEKLCDIRREVKGTLTHSFHNLIENLLHDFPKTMNPKFNTEFTEILNDSRRDIENRLLKVESWFHLVDSKLEDFHLYNQIFAVWNITTKVFPSINCDLEQTENAKELEDIIIQGKYCIHISDILRIFFTNMIKYSTKERHRLFTLRHVYENNILSLQFENKFSGNSDKMNKQFKELLNSYERLQKEGGSGLVKARKILKYDLGCEENEVDIKIIDGKCIANVCINLKSLIKQ